jgi:hypothetical protein
MVQKYRWPISTRPTVWAWSESGTVRFYVGPDWPDTNKRTRLGQEIEPAGLDGPTQISNRAWRAGPKTARPSPGLGWIGPGGPFGHLYPKIASVPSHMHACLRSTPLHQPRIRRCGAAPAASRSVTGTPSARMASPLQDGASAEVLGSKAPATPPPTQLMERLSSWGSGSGGSGAE